jgi:hypothetical protein
MKSTSIVTSSVVALLVGILVTVPVSAQDRAKPKTASSSDSAGSGITKDQADGILDELRQIRQLLEKQQAQLDRVVTPQPSVPGTPEKVQMNVKSCASPKFCPSVIQQDTELLSTGEMR